MVSMLSKSCPIPGRKRMRTESILTESARTLDNVSILTAVESCVTGFFCLTVPSVEFIESPVMVRVWRIGGGDFLSRSCADVRCRTKINGKPIAHGRMRKFKISPIQVCGSIETSELSGMFDNFSGMMKERRSLPSRFQINQRLKIRCYSAVP